VTLGNFGTSVPIVTRRCIGSEDAISGLAALVCAGIAIIALDGRAAYAASIDTHVARGAGITVIARSFKGRKLTASVSKARIHTASIPIVAWHVTQPDAVSFDTGVVSRAATLVITRLRIRREDTTQFAVACIVRARVAIITRHRATRATSASATGVAEGATVSVIAGLLVVNGDASSLHIATIRGAEIAVVAGYLTALAGSVRTRVFRGAGIAVIASDVIGNVLTPRFAAAIFGARVSVIAG
jgi:hypothetical protein